jgi:hypothetical protein
MNQSEQINELVKALSVAQSQITGAKQDSKNPYFESDYADLTSVWLACKDCLTAQGLAVIQTMEHQENKIVLVTTLAHSSGQWIKSYLPVITQKLDSQAIGAALTYSRRYALAAIAGVCPADDDAESAMELSEDDRSKLLGALEKLEDTEVAVEYFRRTFNVYDLNTINRSQFVTLMATLEKRKQKAKGGVRGQASVA